mmetsp:Transcript_49912/g.117462  ORF Transcript_49912/g.117462 Transcript_49912/m.117462 type:complete len:231 (+) Transcript_49912:850-1542(+)
MRYRGRLPVTEAGCSTGPGFCDASLQKRFPQSPRSCTRLTLQNRGRLFHGIMHDLFDNFRHHVLRGLRGRMFEVGCLLVQGGAVASFGSAAGSTPGCLSGSHGASEVQNLRQGRHRKSKGCNVINHIAPENLHTSTVARPPTCQLNQDHLVVMSTQVVCQAGCFACCNIVVDGHGKEIFVLCPAHVMKEGSFQVTCNQRACLAAGENQKLCCIKLSAPDGHFEQSLPVSP